MSNHTWFSDRPWTSKLIAAKVAIVQVFFEAKLHEIVLQIHTKSPLHEV